MLAHSIELSLKAYLLACGMKVRALKHIGHDLDALLDHAMEMHLDLATRVQDIEIAIVGLLNCGHMHPHFKYPLTNECIIPDVDIASRVAQRLAYRLIVFCSCMRKGRT